jgi:catalase
MRFDASYGGEKNYEPNSFDGPTETGRALYAPLASDGAAASYGWDDRATDDFAQAGTLYRLIGEDARARLVDNIAGGLAQVTRDDIVERSVINFRRADPEYGSRVENAVVKRRTDPEGSRSH